MSRVVLVCAFVAVLPATARGEPISISMPSLTEGAPIAVTSHSVSGGFAYNGGALAAGTNIDLGTVFLPDTESAGTLFFSDLPASTGYTLSFNVSGLSGIPRLRMQFLDPLGKANHRIARGSGSSSAGGWNISHASGLERSATFAGGSTTIVADEMLHRGDILILAGLIGADQARVALAIRNVQAGQGFQLRFSALTPDAAAVPEPATMVLLGTGLAGLVAARRRRKSAGTMSPA